MRERIEELLDTVRPAVRKDGGEIDLAEIGEDGIVRLRFRGACATCALAPLTLTLGIKPLLMKALPEIEDVIVVS
jgi:Fe-S cluster biogenesis protein NfuA